MKHNEEKIFEILPKEVRFDEISRESVIKAMKAYGEHIRKETNNCLSGVHISDGSAYLSNPAKYKCKI